MKVEVHLITFNEQAILPYTLRHYRTFADRIVVHDAFSKDDTRKICSRFKCRVEDLVTEGIDDTAHMNLKNSCWRGTDADWVICADADELIYFTGDPEAILKKYFEMTIPVIKPRGYELCSPVFPTTKGQIYEEVKTAGRDDKWYAKPILFSPKMVRHTNFGVGAHDCSPVFVNGHRIQSYAGVKPVADVWLLHCKHLGPVQRIAEEYDSDRTRLSQTNVKNRWGNFEPGIKHANDKRAMIESKLETIFP